MKKPMGVSSVQWLVVLTLLSVVSCTGVVSSIKGGGSIDVVDDSSPILVGDMIVFGNRQQPDFVNSGKVVGVKKIGEVLFVQFCGVGFTCNTLTLSAIEKMSKGENPDIVACVVRKSDERKCVDISTPASTSIPDEVRRVTS